MVDTSERVTVRIPQELLEKLKQIQQSKETPTISDTIRDGLEQYIELNLPPQNVRKVVVELSRQDNNRLERPAEGLSVTGERRNQDVAACLEPTDLALRHAERLGELALRLAEPLAQCPQAHALAGWATPHDSRLCEVHLGDLEFVTSGSLGSRVLHGYSLSWR